MADLSLGCDQESSVIRLFSSSTPAKDLKADLTSKTAVGILVSLSPFRALLNLYLGLGLESSTSTVVELYTKLSSKKLTVCV